LWQWVKGVEEAHEKSYEHCEDTDGNPLAVEPMREAVVLYFGDHDPDGWQIPRSAEDTIDVFSTTHGLDVPPVRFIRTALNMTQIKKYAPPPFAAKKTSSRYAGYCREHGIKDAWELDALSPKVLDKLIRDSVAAHWQQGIHDHWQGEARKARALLRDRMMADGWVADSFGRTP